MSLWFRPTSEHFLDLDSILTIPWSCCSHCQINNNKKKSRVTYHALGIKKKKKIADMFPGFNHSQYNQRKKTMIWTQKNKYNDSELAKIFFQQRRPDTRFFLNFLLKRLKPNMLETWKLFCHCSEFRSYYITHTLSPLGFLEHLYPFRILLLSYFHSSHTWKRFFFSASM